MTDAWISRSGWDTVEDPNSHQHWMSQHVYPTLRKEVVRELTGYWEYKNNLCLSQKIVNKLALKLAFFVCSRK